MYSALVSPEYAARITSGEVFAISVKLMPSASEYCAGASSLPIGAPSFSRAASFHGVEPLALLPYSSLAIPTGTTPSARATSAFTQETVATRVGAFSIVVLPKAWSIVTGNASASADDEPDAPLPSSVVPVEQAARGRTSAATGSSRARDQRGMGAPEEESGS